MKKISVCLATYNGEKYIKEQLQSILHQLNDRDEVVISDDNSTDKTLEVISSLNDKRIKVYQNHYEPGYISNFEHALTKCSGNYIFLCDQDDIWFDNKVEISLDFLKKYDFIASDSVVVNDKIEVLNKSYFDYRNSYFSILGNMLKFSHIGCSFAFNRKILNKALPFPKNRTYCTHDNWIFLIGSVFYKYKVIKTPLFYYRRHGENTSDGGLKSKNSLSHMIKYRIYLIGNILKRAS